MAAKQCEHQEQNEHLGNESENGADTGNDTVKDKTAEPLGANGIVAVNTESVTDQRGDAGNPYTEIGRIGSGKFRVLGFKVFLCFKEGHLNDRIILLLGLGNGGIVNSQIILCKSFLILNGNSACCGAKARIRAR